MDPKRRQNARQTMMRINFYYKGAMIDFKKSDGAKSDKRISAAETSFGNTYSRVGRF